MNRIQIIMEELKLLLELKERTVKEGRVLDYAEIERISMLRNELDDVKREI